MSEELYIISYNRGSNVRTFEYLKKGTIVIPESQKKEYSKYKGNLLTIPDEKDGSVARKRNAVLEIMREKNGKGWIIDDDIVSFVRKKDRRDLSGSEAVEILEVMEIMCDDYGIKYAGFDYSEDCLKLKDQSPISLNKIFFTCVYVDASDGIDYDENFRVMEDVDFFVQKLNHNRIVLKWNQYVVRAFGKDGGKDSEIQYNEKDRENAVKQLNRKYDKQIAKYDKLKVRFKKLIPGI